MCSKGPKECGCCRSHARHWLRLFLVIGASHFVIPSVLSRLCEALIANGGKRCLSAQLSTTDQADQAGRVSKC